MITKKKLCFVVSTASTVQAFLTNHIKILSSEYNITIVGKFNEFEINELNHLPFFEIKSINISRKINIYHDLFTLIRLYIFFKKNNFHIIQSITPKAGFLSMIASFFANINFRLHIFTGQVWANEKGLKKYIFKLFDKIIVNYATHIMIDSKSQSDFLINENILRKQDSNVLGNGSISGVNTNLFKPNPEHKFNFKKSIGLNENDIIILFLGRINRDKGILDLRDAFIKLNSKYLNTYLIVVGFDEENLMPEVISKITNGKILFFGPVSNTYEYYQISDIFCLPSYREGFGTSIIEASSCGIPIVCSDIYGLRDTVVDNYTGLKHLVKDSTDLFLKLSILVENQEYRNQLGRNGIKYVDQSFNDHYVSNEWKLFYSKLINI